MTRGGIIAAGLGSRFVKAGISTPKPLLQVGGRPLIARTLEQFMDAGITHVNIIFREAICSECMAYLEREFPMLGFDFICKDTDSSAESFITLLESMEPGDTALVTTVDSVYKPGMLARFREFAEARHEDALYLGLTSYVEDEKPLYAQVDMQGRISRLGGPDGNFITSGAYLLPAGMAHGKDRKGYRALRALLAEMVSSGCPVYGLDLGKVIDVDRPGDMAAAEAFIANFPGVTDA